MSWFKRRNLHKLKIKYEEFNSEVKSLEEIFNGAKEVNSYYIDRLIDARKKRDTTLFKINEILNEE